MDGVRGFLVAHMIPLTVMQQPKACLTGIEVAELIGCRPQGLGTLIRTGYLPSPALHEGDRFNLTGNPAKNSRIQKGCNSASWRVSQLVQCHFW